ncbi:MAG: hypothetical protein EOO00_00850, partial [Chitinophagaceae bacterium]
MTAITALKTRSQAHDFISIEDYIQYSSNLLGGFLLIYERNTDRLCCLPEQICLELQYSRNEVLEFESILDLVHPECRTDLKAFLQKVSGQLTRRESFSCSLRARNDEYIDYCFVAEEPLTANHIRFIGRRAEQVPQGQGVAFIAGGVATPSSEARTMTASVVPDVSIDVNEQGDEPKMGPPVP